MNARLLTLTLSLPLALLAIAPIRADDRPALTLPEILSRHMQALGGAQALVLPRTERTTTEESAGGLKGTNVTLFKSPGQVWSETKIGLYDDVGGFDGKVAWRRNTDGDVRLLSAEELKDLRSTVYLSTYSYLFPDRLPGRVSLRPETERRTGDYVLEYEPEGGKPGLLFLDPKTFLPTKEQHAEDDLTVTTTYGDYKPVNGVLTATVQRTSNGNKKEDTVSTLVRDERDVDAPDSLFALPAPPRKALWTDPQIASVSVPFNADDHGITLRVTLNGEPADLMLDSGSGDLALSKAASDYLKLPHQGTFQAHGYGGTANIYPVKVHSLGLSDAVRLEDITASAIDLPRGWELGAATPTVGFLGYPLLSRFVVRVDYAARRLTLYNPDTWTPAATDGAPLSLELHDDVPSVTAQFDDLPPARFLLDTGDSGGAVRLYGPYVQDNGLTARYPKGMDVWGEGVGGESKARRVRAHSMAVAGVTLRDVPVDFSLDKKGGASRLLAGALGNDFLSHFTVTFDYPHRRVFFARNAATDRPFDTRTFGLYVVKHPEDVGKEKRRLLIVWVARDSPAYRAGLTPGEELVKIDGLPAADLGLGEARRLLSPDGGADTHRLTVIGVNGGQGDVTVSLYDPMPSGPEAKR